MCGDVRSFLACSNNDNDPMFLICYHEAGAVQASVSAGEPAACKGVDGFSPPCGGVRPDGASPTIRRPLSEIHTRDITRPHACSRKMGDSPDVDYKRLIQSSADDLTADANESTVHVSDAG